MSVERKYGIYLGSKDSTCRDREVILIKIFICLFTRREAEHFALTFILDASIQKY